MWEVFFFNIRIFLSIYEGVKVMKYVSKSTLRQQHQRNRQPRYWYFYYIYTISKSLQSLINNKLAKMTSIMIHIFYISFFFCPWVIVLFYGFYSKYMRLQLLMPPPSNAWKVATVICFFTLRKMSMELGMTFFNIHSVLIRYQIYL